MDILKIELFVAARNLKDKDVFSKSDPFVTFYIKDLQTHKYVYVGRTETQKDNLNPNFKTSFTAEYYFETRQDCIFEIKDDDDGSSEKIGVVETTIGKLMGASKQTSVMDLTNSKGQKQGKLIIRCDNLKDCNQFAIMKLGAYKLMNTDGWFDKSDPFLKLLKIREDNTTQLICETEVIKNNLNPSWIPFEVSLGRLCNGNNNQPFSIECWDWEKSGKYHFIGSVQTTIAEMQNTKDFELQNPKKKHPGILKTEQLSIFIKPSFLDYLRGGLQLNLMLAVDFTGSNGIPNNPSSLHFMNPNQLNQYQQAILSVGEIVLPYDYDKKVPCFGFGAKTVFPTLQSQQVSHCFPLSGNPANVEGYGIQNIMDLYRYALGNVQLAGPTYFGPIIHESRRIAQIQKDEEQNSYTILLILTDGEIHDMKETKDLIVASGLLPLSIIIIGVGPEEFANMQILDGDSGLTDSRGQKATRDLVQFVPIKDFLGNPAGLAKRVLAEVPEQVVKYHQLMGKKPREPVMVDMNQSFSSYGQSQQGQQQQQMGQQQ